MNFLVKSFMQKDYLYKTRVVIQVCMVDYFTACVSKFKYCNYKNQLIYDDTIQAAIEISQFVCIYYT